jgi:lysophospholipase L1-like esterase
MSTRSGEAGVGWVSSTCSVEGATVTPNADVVGSGLSRWMGTASVGPPPGLRPSALSVQPTTLLSPRVRLRAATGPVTSIDTVRRVPSGDVTTYLDGRIDTGLTRPDYFNWPAELNIDLANQQPQLVVVMIGANDAQGLVTQNGSIRFGQPGWDQAYSARVAAFIDEANDAGAHVLWVGMPPMQNPQLNANLMHLNTLVQVQVAETRDHGATYLSSIPALGDQNHNYAAYITDASGTVINIRTPDGIHLSPDGGARLATAVVAEMENQLHIQLIPDVSSKARRG